MRRLRIAAISFLNTAPLMWDFHHPEAAGCDLSKEFEIEYTIPSLCAEALRSGAADIGIIPAITYQRIPDLVIIPNVSIAAKGAVRSILLVGQVVFEEVKTVAIDTSSRTSVALLEILFRQGWIRKSRELPKFIARNPRLDAMLQQADAALLIGDPALLVDHSKYQVLDLAEVWNHNTKLPFVFAFWAVQKQALDEYGNSERLAKIFQQSRDHGLLHIDELALSWAPKIGVTEEMVRNYLTQNINYCLDRITLRGLNTFFTMSGESKHPLQFCAEMQTAKAR